MPHEFDRLTVVVAARNEADTLPELHPRIAAVLQRLDGVEGISYLIDPKAMHKDALYGTLDQTTREWNDGLFTHILRKIVDDVRGESGKRHWIIFDGDVDPEWVENLNR